MNITQKLLVGLLILGSLGLGVFLYISRPLPEVTKTAVVENTDTTLKPSEKIYVASSESSATYEIDETLNGKPKHVVGTTSDIQGQVIFNAENIGASVVGPFKINARTIKTDSERRDNTVGRIVLKSAEPANEFILFEPGALENVEASNQTSEISFTLPGTLTVAGISKPVTFTGTANFDQDKLVVKAQSVIAYADFGIEIPSLSFLAWVDNKTTLTLNFVGTAQ